MGLRREDVYSFLKLTTLTERNRGSAKPTIRARSASEERFNSEIVFYNDLRLFRKKYLSISKLFL